MNDHEATTQTAAELDQVTLRFGRVTALEQFTLRAPRGQVYALLGRNGSGKSTSVRCLLGQLRPTSGRVSVLGLDSWRERRVAMSRIGVVPETPDAPPEATPRQLGSFVSRLYERWDGVHYAKRLERFGVPGGTRFRELSKGQRRHVSLALALAAEPELLILDDPTLGLDAVARAVLFDEVIGELADRGISVLVTTHDLAGIEGVADVVGVIERGRMLVEEPLELLKDRFRRVRWNPADERAAQAIETLEPLRRDPMGVQEEVIVTGAGEEARALLAASGATVESMSLEEIFIALCGERNGGVS